LGYGNLSLRDQLNKLRLQLEQKEAQVVQLQTQLAQQRSMMQVVGAPRVQVVELQSTKPDRNSRGRVLVNRNAARAIFFAENLPALAADQDYELWYIAGSTPVPAGVFQVDANGAAVVEVTGLPEDLSGIHTFAVTLERKGGVPVPTLDQMVLAGKVSA
jgi:anti-sigma-K factor RskA